MFIIEIYKFNLINKVKEQQVLNFYNLEEDLLYTMNDFLSQIYKEVRKYTDSQGKDRTFTLDSKQKLDIDSRIISGYFDSAYTGEKGKVKDKQTLSTKYNLLKEDMLSKDFFYLMHIPKNSKFGFFIVQKKQNHGVKTVFQRAFNSYMYSKGITDFYLEIKQAPPRYLIQNFFNHGRLKELRLIEKDKIDNSSVSINSASENRIFKLKKSSDLTQIKSVLIDLYHQNLQTNDRITFLDKGEFDEIVFVLEYNGLTKTFYINEKEKIRSNMEVTNFIDYIDGEPTYESLKNICLEILNVA